MKFSAVLLLVGVVCVAALAEQDYQFLFHRYINQHGKTYGFEEFGNRFAIFKKNLDLVERHNAEAAQGKHSFTLSMNQFGDMTNDEYRAQFLNLRRGSTMSQASGTFAPSIAQLEALPDSVDWRTKGVVTPVKNQGQCGSCWAFSAVGAMEGAHALSTGTLISLSEQELVDCVNDGADTCDMGGEMHDGYLYAIAAGGMETEAAYPYTATSGNTCKFDKTKSVATFSSYLNVTSTDESALQAAIVSQPTVSVGIDASSIWFQLYSTGVYDVATCKNGWDDLDHGVLVVGYGTDSSKDYWLVKNSWGATWGQAGYIWMSRNKSNQCGIATDATYPLV